MATGLKYLPYDIPMAPVETSGFAVSLSEATALGSTGLRMCERNACILRGDRVPELLGGYEAIRLAVLTAKEAGQDLVRRRWPFSSKTAEHLGYVFHVEVNAQIAMPPPAMATAMARGVAPEVWEALRPDAEEGAFHGIDLPQGRVIFRHARAAGHYREQLMTTVSAGLR